MPKDQQQKKKISFQGLTFTLAIAFLTISVVILLISSSLNIYSSLQIQRNVIDTQQQLIAKEAANTVQEFIKDKFLILEVATNINNLVDIEQDQKEAILAKFLSFEPAFRQLIFFDAQQQELVKVSRLSSFAGNQLKRQLSNDLFLELSQKKPYIGQIYIDDITSEPLVLIAIPVTDIFREFKGIIVAEVNLKFMWDLVGTIKVGEKGLAYVVDMNGNLIAFRDISRVLKGENLAHIEEVNEFVQGSAEIHENKAKIANGIIGTSVVTTHAHLGTPDWAVVVELPVDEAYSNIFKQIRLSMLIILLSVIVAIFLGFYLAKRITKPIIMLRDAAVKVTEGNMNTEITVGKKDEIGDLASTFNQMIEALNASRQNLQEYNRNLEKEVKQRTKLLEDREKKLYESENRYDMVVKTTGQLIYDYNIGTGAIIWNGAIKEITGFDPKEFKTDIKKWEKMIHPNDRERATRELDKAIKNSTKYLVEYRFKQKNGLYKYVSDTGFFLKDKKGKISRMLGAMKDISEQKRYLDQMVTFNRKLEEANQKLKELDKEKDEFISVAAHELKTPLTSIRGFAQLMQDQKLMQNKKKRKHYLDMVNQNTDRLYKLVIDLVDSSRISIGQLKLDIKKVDIYQIYKEIKENLSVIMREKAIKPVFSIDGKLPKINADPTRVLQVLRNLMINAIHFTEKGGTVSLKIYKNGKFVQFEVKDTGEGIPKDKQKLIFSRFYQVDASLTRKVEGSGLGLSICKGLIETMKGKIWFESEVGKGSTFYFKLPTAK